MGKKKISLNSSEDFVQRVLQIFKLVAVDAYTAHDRGLSSSFQIVMNCRRNSNENLSMFVSRFRGLAEKRFMHAQALLSSQTG